MIQEPTADNTAAAHKQGDESMKTWVMKAMLAAVAAAMVLSTAHPASAWWHHRTVTAYAALPSVPVTTGYAPVVVAQPVVAAPVVAASPVVTAGYAPTMTYSAPVTTYSAPMTYAAPVTTYYAPAPAVTTYYSAAPVTTYYAPVRPVIVRRPVYVVP
jgi:hypothetical protein